MALTQSSLTTAVPLWLLPASPGGLVQSPHPLRGCRWDLNPVPEQADFPSAPPAPSLLRAPGTWSTRCCPAFSGALSFSPNPHSSEPFKSNKKRQRGGDPCLTLQRTPHPAPPHLLLHRVVGHFPLASGSGAAGVSALCNLWFDHVPLLILRVVQSTSPAPGEEGEEADATPLRSLSCMFYFVASICAPGTEIAALLSPCHAGLGDKPGSAQPGGPGSG